MQGVRCERRRFVILAFMSVAAATRRRAALAFFRPMGLDHRDIQRRVSFLDGICR